MRLFLFYAFCSVKNQIKKLCKTWFVIFLLACILLGAVIGIGAAMLDEKLGGEELPEDEIVEDDEAVQWTDEEIAEISEYIEPGFAVLTVVIFFFGIISADKSGSAIFMMPDVNLLFPSPRKPQSVLLFRLMNQIILSIFASIYFLIEIPSLVMMLGKNAFAAVTVFISWVFILVYQKLINILIYTLASTYQKIKKLLRPIAFAFVGIALGIYFLVYLNTNDYLSAFKVAFGEPVSRFFPVIGWIKGLVGYSFEGNYILASLMILLLGIGAVLLSYLVWNIKADFYEDAMAQAAENDEIQKKAQDGAVVKRDKDRSDKILRDGMKHGFGANVFFHKALYNRRRFSHLGIFTKTAETYFALATLVSILLAFVVKTDSFLPIGLGLAAIVFFRSLGNPLAEDMDKVYFVTIPQSAHEKVLWSLISGSVACIFDTLPAVIVSALIMRANIIEVVGFYLLAIAIDFYASNVMLFIEFSLPSSLSLQIKQMITVLFIYFGLLPIAAVLFAGALLGLFKIFIFIAAAAALAIGGIVFIFSPMFIDRGRK